MAFLTDEERTQLIAQHKRERDKRICDRIKAVLMRDDGWTWVQISRALLLSEEILRAHLKEYKASRKLKPENGGSKEKLSLAQSKKLINHLENYTYLYTKDIAAYVEASFRVKKSIPDCLFLLIGDGSLYNKLQHQIESSGLQQNFRILGWRNDINEIISILDIFVLSSLNEGMGRVLVEAMVMGKPVVATKVGGIPSVVIDGETGMLVPSKNPRALAEAIISLLNNPERMKNMSIAGKERAKLFSIEVMVEKTEELYEELLRERR